MKKPVLAIYRPQEGKILSAMIRGGYQTHAHVCNVSVALFINISFQSFQSSIPDPVPPDSHVFRLPGSGSISQLWIWILRSSSNNIIVRKTLIPTVLWLRLDFLSRKNYVNVPSKSNQQKNFFGKISFSLASWRSMTKIAGSGSGSGSCKGKQKKIYNFFWHLERHWREEQDPDPRIPKCHGSRTLDPSLGWAYMKVACSFQAPGGTSERQPLVGVQTRNFFSLFSKPPSFYSNKCAGMDNGRELRALDYSIEEVDHIFKTFLSQDFIPQ
jgi:hypothetical protein